MASSNTPSQIFPRTPRFGPFLDIPGPRGLLRAVFSASGHFVEGVFANANQNDIDSQNQSGCVLCVPKLLRKLHLLATQNSHTWSSRHRGGIGAAPAGRTPSEERKHAFIRTPVYPCFALAADACLFKEASTSIAWIPSLVDHLLERPPLATWPGEPYRDGSGPCHFLPRFP